MTAGIDPKHTCERLKHAGKMTPKKVLIVDDSALVRKSLASLIDAEPRLEVMGTAADPYFAAQQLKKAIPDVITLDIEMPRMDGITFLRTLMSQYPIPVVIISSLTQSGTETALQALQHGAVEVIGKPKIYGLGAEKEENRIRIIEAICAAAHATVSRRSALARQQMSRSVKHTAQDLRPVNNSMIRTSESIVVIGASTGGTEALTRILTQLPSDAPGIAIVQHMPENFTRSFAETLNRTCRVVVREAQHGDQLGRGQVLIAPGNQHMQLRRSGALYYVELKQGPLVNRHRPSVDVLFQSAATHVGRNCRGILLTGMGKDGAEGMLQMKTAGAFTVAQDEKSSVVFGMPREAIERGAVDRIMPLKDIHKFICS